MTSGGSQESFEFAEDEKIVGIKGKVDQNDRLAAFCFISYREKAAQRTSIRTIVSVADFNNDEKFLPV